MKYRARRRPPPVTRFRAPPQLLPPVDRGAPLTRAAARAAPRGARAGRVRRAALATVAEQARGDPPAGRV